MYHLLFRASLDGLIVRGPMVDGKHAYVLVRDWLGEPEPVDRDRALPEFARRYLAGHGPASDRDLARWAGIPLRDARRARRAGEARPDHAARPAASTAAARPLRAVPPGLDLAQGHRRRRPATSSPSAGCSTRSRWCAGRPSRAGSSAGGEVALDPFRRLAKADREALERDAADVERFLG